MRNADEKRLVKNLVSRANKYLPQNGNLSFERGEGHLLTTLHSIKADGDTSEDYFPGIKIFKLISRRSFKIVEGLVQYSLSLNGIISNRNLRSFVRVSKKDLVDLAIQENSGEIFPQEPTEGLFRAILLDPNIFGVLQGSELSYSLFGWYSESFATRDENGNPKRGFERRVPLLGVVDAGNGADQIIRDFQKGQERTFKQTLFGLKEISPKKYDLKKQEVMQYEPRQIDGIDA